MSWGVSDPPHRHPRATHTVIMQAQKQQQERHGLKSRLRLSANTFPWHHSQPHTGPKPTAPGSTSNHRSWLVPQNPLKTLCPHCSTSSPPILSLIHPNCILFPEATEMTLAKVPNSFHFAKPHGPFSALIFRDLSTVFSSTVSSFLSKECPSLTPHFLIPSPTSASPISLLLGFLLCQTLRHRKALGLCPQLPASPLRLSLGQLTHAGS